MRRFLLIALFLLLANFSFGLNYYWVGGSGNWSDFSTHWATASGGSSFHVQVPTSNDNVFFDANSFTGNGQTVTIDIPSVCLSMNWTGADAVYSGAVNGPTMGGNQPLEIFGSLIFAANMRPSASSSMMRFLSNLSGNTIDTKGLSLPSYGERVLFSFEGSGEWTFVSTLNTNGHIDHQSGTVNLGNQTLTLGCLTTSSGLPRTLNLNTSTINLVGPGLYAFAPWVWIAEPNGLTLNAGTSSINIDLNPTLKASYAGWSDYDKSRLYMQGGGQTYYNITTASGTSLYFNSDNNTITNLTLNDKADIDGSNTITRSMTLKKGFEYSFKGGSTQTFGFPGASSIAIPDLSFENIVTTDYTYAPAGGNWTYVGGAGVSRGPSFGHAPAPVGNQVCFIQGNGPSYIEQAVLMPSGNYRISFYGSQRTGVNSADQAIKVMVGSTVVDIITPMGGSFQKYVTAAFNIPDTSMQMLHFEGLTAGDNTAFIDKVEIVENSSAPAVLTAVGDCGGLIYIKSLSLSSTCAFKNLDLWPGSILDYTILNRVNFITPITASHSVDQGSNTGVTFNSLGTFDLYWVGGTGTWDDGNHWALTSGGAPSGCIPTPRNNVYFDANSFSGPGQIVTINNRNAYCKDMDWTGASNTPLFTSTNTFDVSLNIYGSLKFIVGMSFNLRKNTNFLGVAMHTVTSAGHDFKAPVSFQGSGTYTLVDGLEVRGIPGNSDSGQLYLHSGTLNTNNQYVRAKGFVSRDEGLSRTLNLGSSIFSVNGDDINSYITNWYVDASNMTLNAGTSIIRSYNNNYNFTGGDGLTYYNLEFYENVAYVTPIIRNTNTFHSLTFYGNGYISRDVHITDSLNFTPGKKYTIEGGASIVFAPGGILNSIGDCLHYIEIKSTNSTQAVFTKPSGTVSVPYTILQNLNATGGATFNSPDGIDNGGNTGWNIIGSPSRNLYWVGDGGNWNDPSHWSLTSGGTPGTCPPTLKDDAFFDANSFTTAGQSVVVDIAQSFCRNMDWTGASNNPTFSSPATGLNVYGSLKLISGMSIDQLNGNITFKGPGAGNTITTAGKALSGVDLYFDAGTGAYTLQDKLETKRVFLQSGTLNTNGYDLLWSSFSANTGTPKTFNLGSSKLTITGTYPCCNNVMWDMRGSDLTFNAGTSTIYWPMASIFDNRDIYGGDQIFNKVIYQYLPGTNTGPINLYGNNTFKSLELKNEISIRGNDTIIDYFKLNPGHIYTFGNGTTTTFGRYANVQMVGTGGNNITIETQTSGQHASWVKSAGKVCTDYIYIRDIDVSGGARWRGGENADPQPGLILDPGVGVAGWDFSAYPLEGTGILSGNAVLCPGESATISIALTGAFPKYITYTDGGINYRDTANSSPYTKVVSPGTTTTYSIISIEMDVCISNSTPPSGTALVEVLNGTDGIWTGRIDTNWFLCKNWASGNIPLSTTDVEISGGASKMPLIGGPGAVCHNLQIDAAASLSMPDATAKLNVYGNFISNGTFTEGLGTVEFSGSTTSDISGSSTGATGVIFDPAATITARGEYVGPGQVKEKAFDNIIATKWLDFSDNSWIQIQYSGGAKYFVTQYSFTSAEDAEERDPLNWTLSASNDGVTWTQIDSRTNEDFVTRNLKRTFNITSSTAYSYYKFDLTNNWGGILQLSEIEFVGAQYTGPGIINFYNLIQSNTSSLHLSKDIGLQNVLTLNDGYIDLNGHTLSVTNSATTAIVRNAGYIKSENTSNLSSVAWQIGSTTGAHIFPFGKNTSTYIPFTLNLTAGDIGNFTVSTYPTAINNTPFPVLPEAVTNLRNRYSADNSLYTADRFWQLIKTGLAATATLTFSYAQEEVDGQNITESLLRAQRYEKTLDAWQNCDSSGLNGSLVTHSNNTISNTVTIAGVRKFSPWTLASEDSPLPVDFTSVVAKELNDEKVTILWQTANERNCNYYQVQRSSDGKTFDKIGVPVKAANLKNYEAIDDAPLSGTNYYRVEMVEFTGNKILSPVREVSITAAEEFSVYPNPASKDNFNVSLKDGKVNEEVLVILYNTLGQEVYSKILINKEGNMLTAINLGDSISPGVYLVVGTTNHAIFKKKILIK